MRVRRKAPRCCPVGFPTCLCAKLELGMCHSLATRRARSGQSEGANSEGRRYAWVECQPPQWDDIASFFAETGGLLRQAEIAEVEERRPEGVRRESRKKDFLNFATEA